jgi:hypothetical protein
MATPASTSSALLGECGCTGGAAALSTTAVTPQKSKAQSSKKKKEQAQPAIPNLPEMEGLTPYFDTHTHLDQILPRVRRPTIYFIDLFAYFIQI